MGKWINIDDLPSGRVEWEDIFDAPSIDIVRCKECRYYHQLYGCQKHDDIDLVTNDDDFCSYGEREGE